MKLIDLLESGDAREQAIAEYLSAPSCLLDEFSQDFRRRHGTPESLRDDEARAELQLLFSTLIGNTFETERLHSKNLRQKRSRVMTHGADINDIGVNHTAWCAPHMAESLCTQAFGRRQSARTCKKKGNSIAALESAKRVQKKVLRCGGGGAWRTFVHMESRQRSSEALTQKNELRPGRVLRAGLGRKYRQLTAAQRRRLNVLGRRATFMHRTLHS